MDYEECKRDKELNRRCDEILHYIWDPIGVAWAAATRDEYHSYRAQVVLLVKGDATREQIVDHPLSIERDRMALPGNPERARLAADVLLDWRRLLWEHAA